MLVRGAVASCGLAAVVAAGGAATATGASEHAVALRGSAPAWTAHAAVRPARASGHVSVRVYLAPRGGLAALKRAVAGSVLGVTGLSAPTASRTQIGPPPAGFRNARPCSRSYGTIVAKNLPKFKGRHRDFAVCGYVPRQFRGAYGVTKREMKSARYLCVVYPGFLYSFFDG